MNIQDLEQKYKELGAEIQRLKQQPEGVWEPKEGDEYWYIYSNGMLVPDKDCSFEIDRERKQHHNAYKTKALAKKASALQRTSNLVIQACLNFDPDFVPDWKDLIQPKIGVYYCYERGKWARQRVSTHNVFGVYVSSAVIADKVLAYLNSQEIK